MPDWFEKITIGGIADQAALRFGPREALYYEGHRWSFAQLKDDVDRAARGFMGLGVQPGEKVSLWMPNRTEWVHILFAIAKIGAILVPINTRFRTADLDYVVRQSDSATLVTVDRSGPVGYLDMVRELCPGLDCCAPGNLRSEGFPDLRRVVVLGEDRAGGAYSWEQVLGMGKEVSLEELDQRQAAVDPDGTALIMYTSGTTGFPKGVMHNILRNITDEANRMGMTPNDVILMFLPLFHAFGLYEGPLMSALVGARMILTTGFDPGETLRLIEQEKATVFHGFDTHFHDIMSHPTCPATDRSSLRTGILPAGMASTEPVARRAQVELFPTLSGWGMTEAGVGGAISFLDAPLEDRCLGSGYPLPGYEMKVIDPATGLEAPSGAMGELCVRGYQVMQAYYKKPEETAKAVDSQGWLHTGDVATLEEDGHLRFMGRYKELLKVGGENVDPVEVEAFLLGHPALHKVQVVGVPDQRLSEVACACVVPKDGHQVSAQELNGLLPREVGRLQAPPPRLFMQDYPMTSSGKVQKFKLREMAMEALDLGSP